MRGQELCIGLDGRLLIAADVGVVIIEEDVLHCAPEELFVADSALFCRRGYGQASARIGRTAIVLCREVICGGFLGCNGLGSGGAHGSNAINRYAGSVLCAPGKFSGLALLYAFRVHAESGSWSSHLLWLRGRRCLSNHGLFVAATSGNQQQSKGEKE
jgi:hypothetical protein